MWKWFITVLLLLKNNSLSTEINNVNNWAVLVCTSRYWLNYRHTANTLSIYSSIKKLGFPDDRIILMLAEDTSCNSRNIFKGHISNGRDAIINLIDDAQIDYKGDDVTSENFLRLLTGRIPRGQSKSKYLNTDSNSNILIYMSGHGGENFLKFQDVNEISSQDIADTFTDMHLKGRYGKILFLVDTCQAGSLFDSISAPSIVSIGSSKTGENSYAHRVDVDVGLPMMDRFTSVTVEFFDSIRTSPHRTIQHMMLSYDLNDLKSTPVLSRTDLHSPFYNLPLLDFLESPNAVQLIFPVYTTAFCFIVLGKTLFYSLLRIRFWEHLLKNKLLRNKKTTNRKKYYSSSSKSQWQYLLN